MRLNCPKMFLDAFSKTEGISNSHPVRRLVGPSPLNVSPLNVFHYYASTIGRIGTKIGVRIDIDSGKKCLEDQGQGVKGQGQIHDFIKM